MSVSSSIGPVSGIDYGTLITGLTSIEQKPIDQITKRLTKLDAQNSALLGVSTLMTGLKVAAASFTSSAVFRAATATSANTSIVTATAGTGTPTGNYSFNVQRLAASSQQVTQGFSSSTTALGLSGNITLQLGGGKLNDAAKLTTLNGGSGVARGSIRVTDRSGANALIDLTHAVDINDVVNTINSATGVNVVAKIDNDRLVITDNTGGSGTLLITNTGGTTTAADLGLTGSASGGTLTGTSLTKMTSTTSLDALNDGNGVRTAGGNIDDFSITGSAGTVNISLSSAKTLNDVIAVINATGQSMGMTAAISSDGHGITLSDSGGGPLTINALNTSLAAYDLGITGNSTTGTLTGDRIISGLTGPLIRNLNGGNQGQTGTTLPQFGTITINGETLDLSNARTLNEALNTINTNSQGVTAALNDSGTGLTLTSSAGSFTVADGTGNLASFLHIAGTSTATATGSQMATGDLRLRYLSDNTRLSTLNGGAGVKAGSIRITAPIADGTSTTVTLDLSAATTIGDVIDRLNSSGLALTARVNDTGDGILLTQTAGTTQAKIEDVSGGTTAANLGLAGTFTNNTHNGSFQKTIAILATDTLAEISTKINNANAGVATSIINDGSGASPYRLSLASRNSGVAGRLIFNGAAAGLTSTTLVEGQDAALVYGGNANGTGGLLATSASNTFASLVSGLTLNLTGVGTTTVAVTSDTGKITDAVQNFVDSYNKVIDNIAEVTKFDSNNATNNGVLFGSSIIQQVENSLGQYVTKSYSVSGTYHNLSAVGVTVGQDGTLSLDTDKFNQALADNTADVRTLFTTNIKAVTGGAQYITSSTTLSSLNSNTKFPGGHISITDGFGAAHDVNLTSAKTISDVITAINNSCAGTVAAGINSSGDGLMLTQVGGTSNASVTEVNGGTAAAFLNIKGTFSNNILNTPLNYLSPVTAAKGIGATMSDLLDRFTNAQIGLLFDATNAISTQETQLKDRQLALAELVLAKKNRLIRQFANLEVTISKLQSQGTALTSYTSSLSKNSSS